MRHVHIAADYHRFHGVQRAEIVPESVFPGHPVVNPPQSVLCVRRVDADQPVVFKLQCHGPALGVMFGDAEIISHREGLSAGEHRRAGIALLFGIAPVAVVAGQHQIGLACLQFGFLDADAVGVQRQHTVCKALLFRRAQAVYIP